MRTDQLLVATQDGCSPQFSHHMEKTSRPSDWKGLAIPDMKARYGKIGEAAESSPWQGSEPKEEGTCENEKQSFGIYINIKHTLSPT
jgi:hypothetical protein